MQPAHKGPRPQLLLQRKTHDRKHHEGSAQADILAACPPTRSEPVDVVAVVAKQELLELQ